MKDGMPGVLFVLPAYGGSAAVVDAAAITSADLAVAIGERLGGADMLTAEGSLTPEQVRDGAVRSGAGTSRARSMYGHLPAPLRVGISDVRDWGRARAMRGVRPLADARYGLVLQLHGRFQDAGRRIARAAGIPFVLRVDALEAREEAAWGIRRPGWGGLVERAELNLLRRADLIASVSRALDEQIQESGIEPSRRMVLPNGVDVRAFQPRDVAPDVAATLGLGDRFAVGWVGGFRPFHGLDKIPIIAEGLRARVPNATLCLMGTGPERAKVQERTRHLGDAVRILDPVPHADVPKWLAAFGACLVMAEEPGDFHYSPMKLYEYLACGRPVVAPSVGQISEAVHDGQDALLVPPGDSGAIIEALTRIARDPALGAALGGRARETAVREASWDARADALLARLEAEGHLPPGTSGRREEGAA